MAAAAVPKPVVRVSSELKMPIAAFLAEATRVAQFATENWATTRDAKGVITQRGLELGGDPMLTEKSGLELTELVSTASLAHAAAALSVPRSSFAPERREAQALVGRLMTLCRWWAESHDDADAKQAVQQLRANTRLQSGEALSLSLERWARLASQWTARLRALPGFDERLVPAATALAQVLRDASTKPTPNVRRQMRDELFRAIIERVACIRRAARFVFASDTERLRLVTSQWKRAQRMKQRRKQRAPE